MRIFTISKRSIWLNIGVLLVIVLGSYYHSIYMARPSLVKDPRTYYMATTDEKVVALTFDDGPDPLYTEDLLDVLKEKNVKATFFVLGENAKQNPDLLKRMSEEGHEIGNHGYSHTYTKSEFVKELKKTDEVIFQFLKKNTRYYRPPGGIVSNTIIEGVRKEGHTLTLWSIDSNDWRNPGSQQIAKNVMKDIFPGAIILLHDGGEKRGQTTQALGIIIDSLEQRGYRFVTLSDLSGSDANIPVQMDSNK